MQFIDVRDLGAWLVRAAEVRAVGDFNATGPEPRVSMGVLLETCRVVSGSDAELVWVADEFLLAHDAGPWMELPLWLAPEEVSLLQIDISHAVAAGLRFRPLAETVADTLAWAGERADFAGEAGMRPEKEAELLAAWRSR